MNSTTPESDAPDRKLSILLLNQAWLAPELRELGHEVVTAGWSNDSFDVVFRKLSSWQDLCRKLPGGFIPDCAIYFDDSCPLTILGLEDARVPMMFYSVDAHHHYEWHRAFCALFSKTLVAQRDYIDLYREFIDDKNAESVLWGPLWSPQVLKPREEKTIDVCFRGTLDANLHPKRAQFFKDLAKLVDIDTARGPYHAAYSSAKIVVNQTVRGDLNFRVFEAMMGGALLLTPRINNGFSELFEAGRECVVYEEGNVEEAAELINYYLAHEDERKEIAARGHQKVAERHSPSAQAKTLADVLLTMNFRKQPTRFLGTAIVYLVALVNQFSEIDTSRNKQIRKEPSPLERELLLRASRALTESSLRRERGGRDFETNSMMCRLLLDRFDMKEIAMCLSKTAWEAHPESLILALDYIDDLVTNGDRDRALWVASHIAPDPEMLVSKAQEIVGEAREKVLKLLPRFGEEMQVALV